MEERWPWEAEESLEASDPFAHQRHEESIKERLPRVIKLLPVQGTVMGSSSPHQTGDIVCYDILKRAPVPGKTRYDWFLSRLADENRIERESPRVIRAADRAWEDTRQGKIKFYLSRWSEAAARGLDLMAQEIAPGERSGAHRHIFEELLLVVDGRGYDLHEDTRHPWEAGDLICVPPMIVHQHVNDGADAARLVSVWPQQPGHELLGGVEQIEKASDWKR